MTTDTKEEFGKLPEPTLEAHEYELWGQNVRADFFTAAQMRAYAAAAVAAERERQAKESGFRFAGWFMELRSGMAYRLWDQGGYEQQPGEVALYERR